MQHIQKTRLHMSCQKESPKHTVMFENNEICGIEPYIDKSANARARSLWLRCYAINQQYVPYYL